MESDIENYKSEINIVNQRIKEFLWKTRYWKKTNRLRSSYSRTRFLEQKRRSRENTKRKEKLQFFSKFIQIFWERK